MTDRLLLFMNPDEGYYQETDLVNDTIKMPAVKQYGAINMKGDGSTAYKITNLSPATATGDALAYGQTNASLGSGTTLGSTTITGGLDMSHTEIINVASPLSPDSAATKAYVDAVASGLDPHDSVVVKTPDGTAFDQAKLLGQGGTGSVAGLNGKALDIRLDAAGAYTTVTLSTPVDMADVASQINTAMGATVAFVHGNNIDLISATYGNNSRVRTQTVDSAITTQLGIVNNADITGFQGAGTGVGKTMTAPTNAASWNTVDGVLLGINDRVLLASEGGGDAVADPQNGVYKVTALGNGSTTTFTLTRVVDFDQAVAGEVIKGAYFFVTGGTSTNTGWTLTTTGAITVDTTGLLFSQFSGAPGLTYDQGLILNVNSVKVDLDTVADQTGAGAGGGTSGLEFDSNTSTGKLRVAIKASTGAIERSTSGGLAVRVDGTTITVNGSNQLVASAAAAAISTKFPASSTSGTMVAGDPVYISANNTATKADTDTDAKSRVVGLCALDASGGAATQIISDGFLASCAGALGGGSFTAGAGYYLKTGGGLTASLPSAGKRVIQVGKALNANDLIVMVHDYGRKAA